MKSQSNFAPTISYSEIWNVKNLVSSFSALDYCMNFDIKNKYCQGAERAAMQEGKSIYQYKMKSYFYHSTENMWIDEKSSYTGNSVLHKA